MKNKTFKFNYKERLVTVKAINLQNAESRAMRKICKGKTNGMGVSELTRVF